MKIGSLMPYSGTTGLLTAAGKSKSAETNVSKSIYKPERIGNLKLDEKDNSLKFVSNIKNAMDAAVWYTLKEDGTLLVQSCWMKKPKTYQNDDLKQIYSDTVKKYKESEGKIESDEILEIIKSMVDTYKNDPSQIIIGKK